MCKQTRGAARGQMLLICFLLVGLEAACSGKEQPNAAQIVAAVRTAAEEAAAGTDEGSPEEAPGDPRLKQIELPPGFRIRVFAEGVSGARSLSLGSGGTLFVGTQFGGGGRLYALRDEDRDNRAERVVTLARGLGTPNGVAFSDGDLYVAEISRILRYRDIEERLDDPPQPEIVSDAFPTDRAHGWKFIRFGPDGMLYVPVGAPCNICLSEDPYASIGKLDPSTGGFEVVARGGAQFRRLRLAPADGGTVVHGKRQGLVGGR